MTPSEVLLLKKLIPEITRNTTMDADMELIDKAVEMINRLITESSEQPHRSTEEERLVQRMIEMDKLYDKGRELTMTCLEEMAKAITTAVSQRDHMNKHLVGLKTVLDNEEHYIGRDPGDVFADIRKAMAIE